MALYLRAFRFGGQRIWTTGPIFQFSVHSQVPLEFGLSTANVLKRTQNVSLTLFF